MGVKFTAFHGIKNDGDAVETAPPFLREASNVDIDDAGKKLSMRQGIAAALLAGNYHSIWSTKDETIMLGVSGSTLYLIDPDGTRTAMLTGLSIGLTMNYVEVDDQIYYSNGQVFGFIQNRANGSFPAITKAGGSRMPPGQFIEHYENVLYTVQGGKVSYSEAFDYGRTSLRKNFLWYDGQCTMFKAVDDGIYCSFGNRTFFLLGRRPLEFIEKPVSDYAAKRGTAVTFDASKVSTNSPLQGNAVYWYSDQGHCIGYQGGQMINFALKKHVPLEGVSGASVVRKTSKGFFQALTILQN